MLFAGRASALPLGVGLVGSCLAKSVPSSVFGRKLLPFPRKYYLPSSCSSMIVGILPAILDKLDVTVPPRQFITPSERGRPLSSPQVVKAYVNFYLFFQRVIRLLVPPSPPIETNWRELLSI